MESILSSVKKLIGIPVEVSDFDVDIITYINTTFGVLNQLGCGPEEGYTVTNESDVWSDFTSPGAQTNLVKTYTALKVGMMFDPSTSSVVGAAKERMAAELEYRIRDVPKSQQTM